MRLVGRLFVKVIQGYRVTMLPVVAKASGKAIIWKLEEPRRNMGKHLQWPSLREIIAQNV